MNRGERALLRKVCIKLKVSSEDEDSSRTSAFQSALPTPAHLHGAIRAVGQRAVRRGQRRAAARARHRSLGTPIAAGDARLPFPARRRRLSIVWSYVDVLDD